MLVKQYIQYNVSVSVCYSKGLLCIRYGVCGRSVLLSGIEVFGKKSSLKCISYIPLIHTLLHA